MKDLLICVLALTWVLAVIRQMGTRRHPRETADHIDRDFRELVDRAHHKATAVPWHALSETPIPYGWSEWDTGLPGADARPRCAFMMAGGVSRTARRCCLAPRHDGDHDMLGEVMPNGPSAH